MRTTTTRTGTRQAHRSQRRRERPKPSRGTTIALTLVILLALVAIPAVAYYEVFIAPLRQTVVRVNDTSFDMGQYIERLRVITAQNKLVGLSSDMSTEPFRVLDILRDDELIRQYGLAYGIHVTREMEDVYTREQLQPKQKEGEQTSQEELDREFQERYRQRLANLKVSDAYYRAIIRSYIQRDIMRERLSDRVPAVAEQIRARTIVVDSDEQLKEVQKRLKNGEDFGAVAKELSKDEDTRRQGGDVGWLPRRVMDRPFDDLVFQLAVGAVSEPFTMRMARRDPNQLDALWIVQVSDRAEVREVDAKAREKLKDRALEDWLEEQRQANQVERYFDSDRYQYAIRKVAEFGAREQQQSSSS